jgi:hypothetical protein
MPLLNSAETLMGPRPELISTMKDKAKKGKARRRRRGVFAGLFLALLCIGAMPAWGVEPYSIEPAQLNPKDHLPGALADKVDQRGWRLSTEVDGLKVSICEVYWVKAASVQERRPGSKSPSHYGDLEPGTLVGVIRFLPEASEDFREDFHDQKLEPGYYSMRYAPQSKGDLSEVLLLSPASADRAAERVLSPDELERRSKLASGTPEPALLSLVPPESSKEKAPSVRMDDEGTCIFQVNLPVKSGAGSRHQAALAVILVTPRKEAGGS